MTLFLKELVLFLDLIKRVINCFNSEILVINTRHHIVDSEIDCGFLPLEVLAQIDYVTMQHMAHISGRKCSAT